MDERIKEVAFADEKLKEAYFKLKEGKFEDKQMFEFINRAIDDLKKNPMSGIRVPNDLIPNAWRLTYTLLGDSVKIISVILEWMAHKEYERKFGYS